jgi:hypothetical protein
MGKVPVVAAGVGVGESVVDAPSVGVGVGDVARAVGVAEAGC